MNDFEYSQRLKLLTQISRIMDLNLSLLPLLKDKELVHQHLTEGPLLQESSADKREIVNTTALFEPVY